MNIIKKEEVKQQQNYSPPSYNYSVYRGGYSSNGHLCYQSYTGNSSNSNYVKSSKGSIAVGGIMGAAFTGGSVASCIALAGGLSAVTGPAAPFVFGASVIGLGIGALYGKLFS